MASQQITGNRFKKGTTNFRLLGLVAFIVITAFAFLQQKPTLFIIGDSTVRNEDESGKRGWGAYMVNYLDTSKILVNN